MKTMTHNRLPTARYLSAVAALLGGLALALLVLPVSAAPPVSVQPVSVRPQFDDPVPMTLTLLMDAATNVLPDDTSHSFTATVL